MTLNRLIYVIEGLTCHWRVSLNSVRGAQRRLRNKMDETKLASLFCPKEAHRKERRNDKELHQLKRLYATVPITEGLHFRDDE